ncbi:hypothetical protein [Spiroplasma ixodetis]|uniref:Uncharacterized protein n=1 Tax=Spiroplasma ixodetis TaxID=2141 RepID=A0ABM8BXJ2_9MOLU|nr:hypothetical protein [Spiroplasma ixodetis]BDT04483.1 hypothetical protein SHM_21290 [Spiroplasma ixodetis]
MKALLKTLSVLTLATTVSSLSSILNTNNIGTNANQLQDLKYNLQQSKDDISLINLNKKGKFYFFNNNLGLVINGNQLWFLDKDKKFQEISNPDHIRFTEFTNGQGGNYGILTEKFTKNLYLLTFNGVLTSLKIEIFKEFNLYGKVTAISNTKFLIETKILNHTILTLGEIKDQKLMPLKFVSLFHTIKEINYIRDDGVIIKSDNGDYSLLVSNSDFTINKLSWTAKYFFKTNREVWVIKDDNNQVLIYDYVSNTYSELDLYGIDIIRLNSKTYILKEDSKNIQIIDSSGQVIKGKYNFEISDDYDLLNINSQLLLLFDRQQKMTVRIIERNLNSENELVVLKTINLTNEISEIKLLNNQENKGKSSTNFFVKKLNNPNYVLNIDANINKIENLEVNTKSIPDGMNGEINRYNKTVSIFTQYKTDDLYWYQVF